MNRHFPWTIPIGMGSLVILLGAAAFFFWKLQHPEAAPLPALSQVPEFSFIERNGKAFGSDDLLGRVWIADFIFTRCGGPCPAMSQRMGALHEEFQDRRDLVFVSVTVDPAYDTPEVLTRYADHYRASPERWKFLTGDRHAIQDLAVRGMLLGVSAEEEQQAQQGGLVHSLRFVLVDRKMQIRGYYSMDDDEQMARLRQDIRQLIGFGESL